jgi:uncharacterized membrane protein YfcA
MDLITIAILLAAGAIGGFVAGLIGVGGGIIFGPVLFYTLRAAGIDDPVLTPLVLGSSLFCTLAASLVGTRAQWKRDAIRPRVAGLGGGFAALAVVLMTTLVTTQPWYDARAFQIVLGLLLVFVSVRMLIAKQAKEAQPEPERAGLAPMAVTGGVAGTIAAAAGVGGGVVLVPAYHRLLRLPMLAASGTSTATIVLISLAGVLTYAVRGLGADVPGPAVGYVHLGYALPLVIPVLLTARLGVSAAHRLPVVAVRRAFAVFALAVAGNLLWEALAA